jgi:DNA replication licensing factor MCM4
MQVAMQQTAVDPTTGTIDMDLIQTGISAGERIARSHLTNELQALIQSASSAWRQSAWHLHEEAVH